MKKQEWMNQKTPLKDNFLNDDEAIAAKSYGFNESSDIVYVGEGNNIETLSTLVMAWDGKTPYCFKNTVSLFFNWLREYKAINVYIPFNFCTNKWQYEIQRNKSNNNLYVISDKCYNSYDEALHNAISYVINQFL